MLTYNEYYERMTRIERAFNEYKPSRIDGFNLHGLNEEEAFLYQAGKYIEALASTTLITSECSICNLVNILATIRQNTQEGQFCFGLFSPDECNDDTEIYEEWERKFVAYSRCNRYVFIGKCSTDFSDYFCSEQALRLAVYCISHNVDIENIIKNKS